VRRATLSEFDKLWSDIEERSRRWAIPIVQDKLELEHVFNLIKGCESYLEIGTAEGNGLYVLAHALAQYPNIAIVDFGEKHTADPRNEVIKRLFDNGIGVREILGNSHTVVGKVIRAESDYELEKYDVVFIDAGHSYEDVIADATAYGHLATKFIIFHDIQLQPVHAAFDWYCKQNPQFKVSTFINSREYGYGIVEVE